MCVAVVLLTMGRKGGCGRRGHAALEWRVSGEGMGEEGVSSGEEGSWCRWFWCWLWDSSGSDGIRMVVMVLVVVGTRSYTGILDVISL